MIRKFLFAPLLLLAALASPAHAKGSVVDFSLTQQGCVEAGQVTLGPHGRWPACRVSLRGWFATIGLLDFYQAQYCLGGSGGSCEHRALLIFTNRAYNRAARLVLQRIDPGHTQYDDPLVVQTGEGPVLVISVATPGGAGSRRHYLWQTDRWVEMDAKAWLRELARRLPDGTAVRNGAMPEAETMSARVPLYRRDDADCCPSGGVANVELGVIKGRFAVKRVTLAGGDE